MHRNAISLRKCKYRTDMDIKKTVREFAATSIHLTDTKEHNSNSMKNDHGISGVTNIKFTVISMKGKLTDVRNKFKNLSIRCISDIGRELNMRTGKSPGLLSKSPGAFRSFPEYVREISEVLRSFSKVFRSFSGLAGRIPEVLRGFSDKIRNLPGRVREISGSFRQLPEVSIEFSGMFRNFPKSMRGLSEVFRYFSGLSGDFPAESGDRQWTIKN